MNERSLIIVRDEVARLQNVYLISYPQQTQLSGSWAAGDTNSPTADTAIA